MAGGANREYRIGVTADTSLAKAAIADLLNSLKTVMNQGDLSQGLNRELTAAAAAAKEIANHLNKATNSTTGKLDMSVFNKSLASSNTSLLTLTNNLLLAGRTGLNAFNLLSTAIATADAPIKKLNGTLASALTTLKNTVKWQLSSLLVHGIQSTMSGAISYVEDLNKSLTNISVVTGQSTAEMAKFAEQANKAAQSLSTTTKAYADAALIYYQLGDNSTMAAKKAEITTKAAATAFSASAKEMSQMLTAVWNSYNVGEDQLLRYVDVMTALGQATASSSEEIMTAMLKVAATANTVGVSVEQMSAMIATVSSTTRLSAESIGTSMQTILSRIGGLKLGQTLEDGVDLNKYSTGLKAIGVNVLDAAGELRNMGDVITELMGKWQQLSTAQLSATAQLIGGARQYTTIMALMSNASKYLKNLAVAQGSEGTLNKLFSQYEKGLEATKKRYRAATEELYSSLINDQGLKAWTEGLTIVVKEITNITNALGGLPGIITTISSLFVSKFSGELGAGFDNLLNKVTLFNEGLTKGKGFLGSLTSITSSEIQKYLSNLDMLKLGNLLQRDMIGTDMRERSWSPESQLDYAKAQEETIKRSDDLIKAREDLLKNSKHMSQDQINNAQEQLRTQGELLTNLQQQKATYGDMIASMEKATNSGKNMLENTKALSDQNETVLELLQRVREANEEISLTAKSTNPLTQETTAREVSSTMSDIFKYTDSTGGTSELYMQSIASTSKAIGAGEDAVIALNNALASTDSNGTTAATALQTFADTLDAAKFNQQADDVRAVAKAIDQTGSVSKVTQEDITKVGEALSTVLENSDLLSLIFNAAGLGDIFKTVADSAEAAGGQIVVLNVNLLNFDENTQRIKTNASNTSQAFLVMTKAAMQSVMMFLRMSNAIKNWDKMDLSAKITSIGMMIVPLVTTAVNAFTVIKAAGMDAGASIQAAFGWISIVLIGVSLLASAFVGLEEKNALIAKEISAKLAEIVKTKSEAIKAHKEESDALEDSYLAFKKANDERKKTGEISDDYTSAVGSVLDALDAEYAKVYLLSGSYDTLAASIENATKAKLIYNAKQSLGEYQEAERAAIKSMTGLDVENYDSIAGKNTSVYNKTFLVRTSLTSATEAEEANLYSRMGELYLLNLQNDSSTMYQLPEMQLAKLFHLLNYTDANLYGSNEITEEDAYAAIMSDPEKYTAFLQWLGYLWQNNNPETFRPIAESKGYKVSGSSVDTQTLKIGMQTVTGSFMHLNMKGDERYNPASIFAAMQEEGLIGENVDYQLYMYDKYGLIATTDGIYVPTDVSSLLKLDAGLTDVGGEDWEKEFATRALGDISEISGGLGGLLKTDRQDVIDSLVKGILASLDLESMTPQEVEDEVFNQLKASGLYIPEIDGAYGVRSQIGTYYNNANMTVSNNARRAYAISGANQNTMAMRYGTKRTSEIENALTELLAGSELTPTDVMSNITDISQLGIDSGLTDTQIARRMMRQATLNSPITTLLDASIGLTDTAFSDVYKNIGTFETKPENKSAAAALFDAYYTGAEGTFNAASLAADKKAEFFVADATRLREILDAMAAQSGQIKTEALQKALVDFAAVNASELYASAFQTAQEAITESGLDKEFLIKEPADWDSNAVAAAGRLFQSAKTQLQERKAQLEDKIVEAQADGDEETANLLLTKVNLLDSWIAQIDEFDLAVTDILATSALIEGSDTSTPTTHRELQPHEKFTNLQGLLTKTNLDVADWLTLVNSTGMTYELLSAQGINNNAVARQNFLLGQMKALRANMVTETEQAAERARINREASEGRMTRNEAIRLQEALDNKTIISQTAAEEMDATISTLENYTLKVSEYTAEQNNLSTSINQTSTALTALSNIDLTNLSTIPKEGTLAYEQLSEAITALGDDKVTKAFDTLTNSSSSYLDKLQAQTAIESALYDLLIENYTKLRNIAQTELDAMGPYNENWDDDTKQLYLYWQQQVIDNENKITTATQNKQKTQDDDYLKISAYYKAQIDYETELALKLQERQMNAKKAQADLASSLAQDAQNGIMSQDAQNALLKYITLAHIARLEVENLTENWANAKTSQDRFKIASNAALQGFIGQAEQYDTILTKTAEAKEQLMAAGTWDAYNQSWNAAMFMGSSDKIQALVEEWISGIEDADLQGVMLTAWSKVTIGADDTAEDIRDKFITALTEAADSAEISLTDLATEFGTSMSSIISTQLSLEQSAAEAVAQVWTNAFNTIKSVRSSIFNGTDQTSMIAQDTKTAFAMWQGYKQNNENATVDSFLSAARAGQLSADNYDYAKMMPQLVAAERERLGLNNLNAYYQYTPGGYNGMNAIRAATARDAGLTYTTGNTNIVTGKNEQGEATYTYNGKTYSGKEFLTALSEGGELFGADLKADQATMDSFLSSIWGTALSEMQYTPENNRSLSQLISDALSGDQGAIAELIAALGNADSAIAAWSQAVLESTAAAERLAKVQKESEKYGTYASDASRIASVRASYEQSDHKLSWEDYATLQGLLSSEITLGTALSAQELYGNAASWYDQLAESWTAAANAELEGKSFFERLGIMANYDSQYNQNMRQARTSRQNAAAARGQGEQAEQTEDQKKLENQMAATDRLQTRLSSLVELGQTMRSNYESFLKTGTLTADVAQKLLAVGKDPTTIRTAELYKAAMKELTDAQTALNDSYKEQMQTYSAGKNGYQSTMFDNITSTMTFDEWLDTLDDTLLAWAESDSALLGYFNDYVAGLQAAETAQLGLSTDAIELGVNISAAMAKATAEATKLEKTYNKVAGVGSELMSSLEKGLIESATARKLSQIGLTEQWKGAENILGRAQVAALAQAKEALMQIDYLSAQNAGALNLRNVLGLSSILNTDAIDSEASPLARSFMTAFGEGLKNTNDAQQAFLEVLASPAFKTLPPETLNTMQSAFSTAISRVGSEADATTYWNAFVAACQEAGDDANEIISAVITGLDDAWASTITSIVSAEQAAAAEVLSIWQSTFETIAAMHEAAFTGKSISSALDSADDYINAFLQSGATNAQEFAKFISLSGSAAQEKVSGLSLELPTQQEMATSLNGLASFVDWNEDGTLAGIYDSWEAVKTAVTQNLKESAGSVDEFVEGMSDELVTSLKQAGYTVDKTAKTITDANGNQIESMEALANMFTEQDWKNLWASLFAIPEMYRQKAIEQNGTDMQLRVTGGALPQKIELNGETYSDMTSLRQAYDTKWQSGDAALLEKAMGLTSLGQFGVKGQSTEGILTPLEWTRLQELGATTTDLAATVHQNYLDLTKLVEKLTQLVAEQTKTQIGEGTDQYGNKVSVDTGTARTLTEGETMLADEAIMESGEVAKIVSELAVLNIQTAADATVQAAQDALNGLTDNTQTALNNAAEALGKTRKELEEYELALATTEGTTESFNQMNAENPVLMANAAVEYDKCTTAVQALENALKATSGAFAILASSTSTLEQQTQAYENLRDAVNNYFNDLDGAVDTDFVKENLEDIKDWAKGSVEAMEKLERKILETQLNKMISTTGKQIKASAEQLDRFNKIANGLKFGEKLKGSDVVALRQLQKELGLTNADLKSLADTMGITAEWGETAAMTAGEFVDQFGGDLAAANEALADTGLQILQAADGTYLMTGAAEAMGDALADGAELAVDSLEDILPPEIDAEVNADTSEAEAAIDAIDSENPVVEVGLDASAVKTDGTEEFTGENSADLKGVGHTTVKVGDGDSVDVTGEVNIDAKGDTKFNLPKFAGTGNRPGGGGGCFVAGTLIATINGYKKIEEIQKGDIVLSYNEQYQHNEYSKVVQTMIHHIATAIYTLYIDNDKLQVTGIHRFYINRNNQYLWVHAYDLLISDLVLFADGTWHLISNIVHNFKIETVYNFEVSNNHNYYVGRNRILVHNKGGGGGCFVAGTPIMMGGYYLNIEKVKPGDLVLSYDEYTKTNTYSKVLLTMIHIVYDDIYTLYTGNDKLVVTGIHRFYILRDDKIEWIAASDLQIGDKVLFANNTWHVIYQIDVKKQFISVYNFEVSNTHNYYVGYDQILAHNKGGGRRERRSRDKTHKDNYEKTRYHDTDRAMTIQSDKLTKLNKLKSFKYGGDYLAALKKENQELSKQIGLNTKKIKEAKEFADIDKKRLQNLASKGVDFEYTDKDGNLHKDTFKGAKAHFDKDGNLDFERYQDDMWKKYNEMVNKWNNLSADAQEEQQSYYDAWFEQWQKEMDTTVENYEEAQDRIREAQEAILDNIATMSANSLEAIQYTVELKLDTTDFDRKYEDLVQKKLSRLSIFNKNKNGKSTSYARLAASLLSQMEALVADIATYQLEQADVEGRNKLYHLFRDQYKSDEEWAQAINDSNRLKTLKNKKKLTNEEKKELKELQDAGVTTQLAEAQQSWLTDADYLTALTKVRDGILTAASAIEELQASYDAMYSNIWAAYDKDYDRFKTVMEHKKNLIDSFLGMLELMGKGENYDLQMQLYAQKADIQYDTKSGKHGTKLIMTFGDITFAQLQLDLMQKKLEDFKKAHGGDAFDIGNLSEQEKNDYLDLLDRVNDAQDQLLTSTKETLEALRGMYEAQVNKIADEFESQVVTMFTASMGEAGKAISSFQDIADEYAWYNEEQERYLNTSKLLYEVSKLNRLINDSLADMTTKASKERLVALQEEIKALQKKGDLTEYDIKQMQLQYELALALDDLENAQNDKTTVRLVRDDEGNMGYQYTADEDKVSEAQLNYEDKLQAINDLATARVKELEQGYVDTMNEYYTKAREIATMYSDDEETRTAKLQELYAKYQDKLNYYNQQYANATSHLIENQTVIFNHYGETGRDAAEGINTSLQSIITTFNEPGGLNSAMADFGTKLQEAMKSYGSAIAAVTKQIGGTKGLLEMTRLASETSDEMEGNVRRLNTALNEQMRALKRTQRRWEEYKRTLLDALRQAEDTARAINDLKRAAADEADEDDDAGKKYHVIGTNPKSNRIEEYGDGRGYKKESDAQTAKENAERKAKWTGVVITKYESGGLADKTGPAWLDGTLNKPEYVLDAEDTQKMFDAVASVKNLDVEYIEDLLSSLQMAASAMIMGIGGGMLAASYSTIKNDSNTIQLHIEINADFPNATSQSEIVAAFEELSTLASQYVSKGQ